MRLLSYGLVWSSFYEQLAWAPVLVILATAAGDPKAVAVAASAYSLANLLGNLAFGFLSDRLGRHRVAGAGLLGMAATALLHLTAGSPAMLVGVRFLHGLTAAAVAPAALAAFSDGLPGSKRGEAMARVGLVIALASMASPPITGRLARSFGVGTAISILAAGLALVGGVTLIAAARGPATAARPVYRKAPAVRSAMAGAVPGAERINPALTLIGAAVAFAIMFGQNVLFYALPLRGAELGMGPAQVGGLLSAFAVGALVAFVPPLSRAADRWGRLRPLLAGLGLTAAGLMGLAAASGAREIALSLIVYGLGFGLAFPAVTALSADAAGQGRRGLAFGVLTAAFSAGAIVGPLASRALDAVLPPFAVAAMVAALGIAVALVSAGQFRPTQAPPFSQ
jgi:MFS transporter, DHA1 family, multidrug resistance protein